MGRHNLPSPGESPDGLAGAEDASTTGRRRRTVGGRRGVSIGVIAALVAVVVLVGGVILWRFFGEALSRRSSDAASQCLKGTAAVAVVADPSIFDDVKTFAERYNADGTVIGDTCVNVVVTGARPEAVVAGLAGSWPSDLGERPALWIPAGSIPVARLQAAVGTQIVSDARSLVTSPVVLAVRPELKEALGTAGWQDLPGLQGDPRSLENRGLPGWGSLRLALPVADAADARYLTAEAVAVTSAPPNAPSTAGLPAARSLLDAAPRLPDDSAEAAFTALTGAPDPAAAPVHAVALTEQQLYRRTSGLADAPKVVASWFPGGPAAIADYPTVLLGGPWLSAEQVAAASEFARFMRQDDQQADLAKSGFRTEGAPPEGREDNDVVDFAPLSAPLPTGDDAVRAAVAAVVTPGVTATTAVVLNEGLTGDEGGRPRLANVTAALRDRINALPPSAAVGLWTFNKVDSAPAVPTGPLSDAVGGLPRAAAITGVLDSTTPTSGGGVSFTTLRAAFADAVANYRPGQPNSVLVITQGPHTDQSLDGQGLQDAVKNGMDPNRPVVVNVIGFGGDPDRAVWEAVTRMTGGSFAEVPTSDSPDLVAAISRMLP